jgi:hypothetical protein
MVKQTHNAPMNAQGERIYSSYSFMTSTLDGVSGQSHAPAAPYPQGMGPRYPLYRRLGGPQSQSEHRGYWKNPSTSAGDRTSIARYSSPYSDTILTELPRLPDEILAQDYIYTYIYALCLVEQFHLSVSTDTGSEL